MLLIIAWGLHTELAEDTVPEILRCSLSSISLQLLALGVTNILKFDFIAPPPKDSLLRAVEQLYLLGAVEEMEKASEKGRGDDTESEKDPVRGKGQDDASKQEEEEEDFSLQLTSLGHRLAHFPLEPTLANAILSSQELGCSHEVISVVSMLSVDSVTYSPRNKKEAVNAAHRKFISEDGDHVTLLNIYRAYKNNKGNKVRRSLLLSWWWYVCCHAGVVVDICFCHGGVVMLLVFAVVGGISVVTLVLSWYFCCHGVSDSVNFY